MAAPHNRALRRLEALVAIEAHSRLFACAPALAAVERLLSRSCVHIVGQLRWDGCLSRHELRLTGAGVREMYWAVRTGELEKPERRAA